MTASSVPCALFLSLLDEERGGQLAAGLVHCNSIRYVQMSESALFSFSSSGGEGWGEEALHRQLSNSVHCMKFM